MLRKIGLALFTVLYLAGCASSSPYTYHTSPTPIKAKETQYYINSISVNLTNGPGAIPGDNSFASKERLEAQFQQYMEGALEENKLLSKSKPDSVAYVDVTIDYKRTFNYGGKSLNKPHVTHKVLIKGDKQNNLVSFSKGGYTTQYGYFGDTAVNLEIASFNWDAEDELKDIELISNLIAKDLINAGL